MKKYYSVFRGHCPGVYLSWAECQRQIAGFHGAKFKSFRTLAEAQGYARTGRTADHAETGIGDYVIYTDGSAMDGRAGCGIHFARPAMRYPDISEPLRVGPFTNQRAEAQALLIAVDLLDREGIPGTEPVTIFSDSTYSIKAATEWHKTWTANGWKTANGAPVMNRDILEPLALALQRRSGTRLVWVKGHAKIAGNERADVLAKAACKARR